MLTSLFKPNIKRLQSKRDIPGLIQALAHKDEKTRAGAARSLGEIGDPGTITALIPLLDDWSELVRQAAEDALVCFGPAAVEPLIAQLADDIRLGSRYAAEALGKLGDPRAIEPLLRLFQRIYTIETGSVNGQFAVMGKPNFWHIFCCCRAAANALPKLQWQPGNDRDGALYNALTRQYDRCIAIGQPAVQALKTLYYSLWFLEADRRFGPEEQDMLQKVKAALRQMNQRLPTD